MTRARHPDPPAWIEWLLARCLPTGVIGDSVLGDLREEYGQFPDGIQRDLWYLATATGLALGGIRSRLDRLHVNRHRNRKRRRGMSLIQDVRWAVRLARKRRGITLASTLTLGLGIGATVAIASLVDAVLLRPLPFERSEELVTVWNTYPSWQGHEVLGDLWDRIALSYPEFADWRRDQESFSQVAIFRDQAMALRGGDEPRSMRVGLASDGLFRLLEVTPILGRRFESGESGVGAPAIALLSHPLWQGRYGGRSDVLGETILLDDEPYEVVGVLPPEFRLRSAEDQTEGGDFAVWIPIGSAGADLADRGLHIYEAIGRLRGDVTLAAAQAEAAPLLRGNRDAAYQDARLVLRHDELTTASRRPLLMLLGASSFLMLIACGNVASLLLGAGARRRHEMATRVALGATGGQMVRQLLFESAVLGLLGAVAGIAFARLSITALLRLAPPALAMPASIPIDLRILGLALGLGICTGVVFGLAPALLVRGAAIEKSLRDAATPGRPAGWHWQRRVTTCGLTLALLLMVAAGLLGRSLFEMSEVDPGFRDRDVLTAELVMRPHRFPTESARLAFLEQVVEQVESLPGVESVSAASAVPFSGDVSSSSFVIDGRPESEAQHEAVRMTVLPGFHETLGIPLLAGRPFTRRDDARARPVVMISAAMAERFWPDGSAIGARIHRDDRDWEIIGIVDDILHGSLTDRPRPTFYFPRLQEPIGAMTLVVATAGRDAPAPTASLPASVRAAVWSVDNTVPVDQVDWLPSLVVRSLATARYRTVLILAFAISAALLAAVGLFGTATRAVVHRLPELGIRMALGAERRHVVSLVLVEHVRVLLISGLAGLSLAALLSHAILRPFLFAVTTYDASVFALAGVAYLLLGLSATLIPTWGSARVSPAQVLRRE